MLILTTMFYIVLGMVFSIYYPECLNGPMSFMFQTDTNNIKVLYESVLCTHACSIMITNVCKSLQDTVVGKYTWFLLVIS